MPIFFERSENRKLSTPLEAGLLFIFTYKKTGFNPVFLINARVPILFRRSRIIKSRIPPPAGQYLPNDIKNHL
jgi:hypothetical protein